MRDFMGAAVARAMSRFSLFNQDSFAKRINKHPIYVELNVASVHLSTIVNCSESTASTQITHPLSLLVCLIITCAFSILDVINCNGYLIVSKVFNYVYM